jgi:NADPH:quinone reductase-like Zn-dependent oxidoreductase
MRAVFVREVGGVEALSLDSAPDPIPGPDDVVIDVQSTAANFVDLLVIDGKYQFLRALPFIPGKLPIGAAKLRPPPTTTFRLDKAKDALHMLRDRQAIGRIVLLPPDDGAKSGR